MMTHFGRFRREAGRASGLTTCLVTLVAGCTTETASPPKVVIPTVAADVAPAADPVIAAVGDLVCGSVTDPSFLCQAGQVAALLPQVNPDAILLLGDIQYERGTLSEFNTYFAPLFGAYRSRTYPAPGNHEYGTSGAQGYFDYFNGVGVANGPAGPRGKGYYSFNLGSWHVVVLNSNCAAIGGCGVGSAMEQWLRADLAANPASCTLAVWHHPRFSSGRHGSTAAMQPIWQALYDFDADLVLSGHDHAYERFAPQTASGGLDNARGLRSFVVGTGGKNLGVFPTVRPNSERRDNTSSGWLRLTVHPTSYDWQFVPIAGHTLNDAGTASCHGSAPPPPPPVTLTVPVAADAYVAQGKPTANRGSVPEFVVDSTPFFRTYLRFAVTGVGSRVVKSAKLRLYAIDPSPVGGRVHRLSNNTWGETTITFANAPAHDQAILATFGSAGTNAWVEVDVTAAITGDGTFSFALDSPSTDAAIYRAREAGTATAAQLVLTVQ